MADNYNNFQDDQQVRADSIVMGTPVSPVPMYVESPVVVPPQNNRRNCIIAVIIIGILLATGSLLWWFLIPSYCYYDVFPGGFEW